jgi:NTP pyrophosphatase (non-canonical NTP hydrolase)
MGIDLTTSVLRRRVVGKLRPLANFFDLELTEESDDGVVQLVDEVISRATDAALRDEWLLAWSIASIDQRFDASWPQENKVESLMRRVHGELAEVRQAIIDAEGRPDLRPHVVEELGDVMMLLARLALVFGAKSSLEPLQVVVRKTFARLAKFEQLCRTQELPPGNTPAELWSIAKRMVS